MGKWKIYGIRGNIGEILRGVFVRLVFFLSRRVNRRFSRARDKAILRYTQRNVWVKMEGRPGGLMMMAESWAATGKDGCTCPHCLAHSPYVIGGTGRVTCPHCGGAFNFYRLDEIEESKQEEN